MPNPRPRNSAEAAAALLHRLATPSTSPLHVVTGPSGAGKTALLLALSTYPDSASHFPFGVHLLPPVSTCARTLHSALTTVACKLSIPLYPLPSDAHAAAAAIANSLRGVQALLLVDGVRADEDSDRIGHPSAHSLLLAFALALREGEEPAALRVVISGEFDAVAPFAADGVRTYLRLLSARGEAARGVLCRHAEFEEGDVEGRAEVADVLLRCGGLQLALAVAGASVRAIGVGSGERDRAWEDYSRRLEYAASVQARSDSSPSGLFAVFRVGLDAARDSLVESAGEEHLDVRRLFVSLSVLPRQRLVPLSVLCCLWSMTEDVAEQMCEAFSRVNLLWFYRTEEGQQLAISDLVHDYCVQETRAAGISTRLHNSMLDGLYKCYIEPVRPQNAKNGWRLWWALPADDSDKCGQEYMMDNLMRHLTHAERFDEISYLCSDFRWWHSRMAFGPNGNDMSGILDDVGTVTVLREDSLEDDLRLGLYLLLDAACLSMHFVAQNPIELPFQFYGRLVTCTSRSHVVKELLSSLERHAQSPWLRPGAGVLRPAGSPLILSVTVASSLWCVEVLPGGERVVVGGKNGYLAIFNISYGCVECVLKGHEGDVLCLAVSPEQGRILSGGEDGAIRSWDIASRYGTGYPLVQNESAICSLALPEDEDHVAFCDAEGMLHICDADTGEVRDAVPKREPDHTCTVAIQHHALRAEDTFVVSGSPNGIIRRWDLESGEEFGDEIRAHSGDVNSIAVSTNGYLIAYAGDRKVGVLNSTTKDIYRDCETCGSTIVLFGEDDETVFFGEATGTTTVLKASGEVVSEVKAHNASVSDIALSHDKELLISVSKDGSLSVQRVGMLGDSSVESSEEYRLGDFVVLPDRQRLLYSWSVGPTGLQLVDLRRLTALESPVEEEELTEISVTIGSPKARVTAIAISHDGCFAIAGTINGKVLMYDTQNWQKVYCRIRGLPGAIWSIGISPNSLLMAAGSSDGAVVLYKIKDGVEVQLPLSAEAGKVRKVAFNEESSTLLAVSSNPLGKGYVLQRWTHFDCDQDIAYTAIPLETETSRCDEAHRTELFATETHVATRNMTDKTTSIFEFETGELSIFSDDNSHLLDFLGNPIGEFNALEAMGTLSTPPSACTIGLNVATGVKVLGTLESALSHRFLPNNWVFDDASCLFIAGNWGGNLVRACLVSESEKTLEHADDAIPSNFAETLAAEIGSLSTTGEEHYSVFLSHAGPDKEDIAIPLHTRLTSKGMPSFVDKEELRPGQRSARKMDRAMETAEIGVFILSPEFVGRKWPMKELICFLERVKSAEANGTNPPIVIPVFYRLGVGDCKGSKLYDHRSETGKVIFEQGFFAEERQKDMPTSKAKASLSEAAWFTGIENEEGAQNERDCVGDEEENRARRKRLIDRIVSAVVEANKRYLTRADAVSSGA